MDPERQRSIRAVALFAAFVDGAKHDRRRPRDDTVVLKDTFQNLLGPAKQMQTQYLPQIQQQASILDVAKIMAMVRGG
jgi:hypothetical protein